MGANGRTEGRCHRAQGRSSAGKREANLAVVACSARLLEARRQMPTENIFFVRCLSFCLWMGWQSTVTGETKGSSCRKRTTELTFVDVRKHIAL
jgi:hypothetical protein